MLFGSFRVNSGLVDSVSSRAGKLLVPLSRNRFPIYIFYAYDGDSMKVRLKRSYIQFYLANGPILPYFLRLMKNIFSIVIINN